MNVRILPSKARGSVAAPPSKSMAHRLLICAALAEGESILSDVSPSEDVLATVDCLRAFGVDCQWNGSSVRVKRTPTAFQAEATLPCRESGSTLRFLLPLALLTGKRNRLSGAPSLLARPMQVYETLCRENGFHFQQTPTAIEVQGTLRAGNYTLPGNVSSQFISGMLFALSQTAGESVLHILPPVESRSYLSLTVAALRTFGARVEWRDEYTLTVVGDAPLCARSMCVEGDYSNAAFLEAFRLFGGNVTVTGLSPHSLQGDRVFYEMFAALQKGSCTLSLADCPDLAPILFAVAAAKHGATFTDTRRLRIKESDRAAVMAEELSKFGTRVTVSENCVEIHPEAFHAPTEPLCGHNDHRVVMSLSVLLSLTGGVITGAEACAKSFPDFFKCIRSLGIQADEIDTP